MASAKAKTQQHHEHVLEDYEAVQNPSFRPISSISTYAANIPMTQHYHKLVLEEHEKVQLPPLSLESSLSTDTAIPKTKFSQSSQHLEPLREDSRLNAPLWHCIYSQLPDLLFPVNFSRWFIILTMTLYLVKAQEDCAVLNAWIPARANSTGCCSQSGIKCVGDRITEMYVL
jgi:hypothetical protein